MTYLTRNQLSNTTWLASLNIYKHRLTIYAVCSCIASVTPTHPWTDTCPSTGSATIIGTYSCKLQSIIYEKIQRTRLSEILCKVWLIKSSSGDVVS